jgi:hypothetical protein
MLILFFVLSAALLLLAVLLLWFVPYLLQQQEERAAKEAKRLRELLADVLGEQEAVTMRQAQLGTSLSYLQDQIEQLATNWPTTVDELMSNNGSDRGTPPMLGELNERIAGLQGQLELWAQQRSTRPRNNQRDNESWAYLMSLLGTMQERLGTLEKARQRGHLPYGGMLPTVLPPQMRGEHLDEGEMEDQLRSISEELATLQWRIQRSLQPRMMQIGAPNGNGHSNGHGIGGNGANGAGPNGNGANGANGNGAHGGVVPPPAKRLSN